MQWSFRHTVLLDWETMIVNSPTNIDIFDEQNINVNKDTTMLHNPN